jgi:hypothetical protein
MRAPSDEHAISWIVKVHVGADEAEDEWLEGRAIRLVQPHDQSRRPSSLRISVVGKGGSAEIRRSIGAGYSRLRLVRCLDASSVGLYQNLVEESTMYVVHFICSNRGSQNLSHCPQTCSMAHEAFRHGIRRLDVG